MSQAEAEAACLDKTETSIERKRLTIEGQVQGIGFRPFVYRLANALGLAGWVANGPQGVVVEVEGDPSAIDAFLRGLEKKAPATARIDGVHLEAIDLCDDTGFTVRPSLLGGEQHPLDLVDRVTCSACLDDIRDPENRRYRYPFATCTACGPRHSIVDALPYDRARTAMAGFIMCATCQAEYDDPADRRFHAETQACPDCGPLLVYQDDDGKMLATRDEALEAAAADLRAGLIVALKGLGGFQLIVDARNEDAVARLRERKHRPEKPLALMVRDLDIVRYGLDQLLSKKITLIHGPGCPVCVTPTEVIEKAIEIARRPDVILCSFGDMLRVPGSEADLLQVKSTGGDVRIVYSPLDALTIAKAYPDRETVFLAVGFETTAPANAKAAYQAKVEDVKNFSMLVAHVLVPPAIEALLDAPDNRVDGFLAAGHVCTIMGVNEYRPLAERYRVPIVVTGFEPLDILTGVLHCVRQLEGGRAEVENVYGRAVREDGNHHARDLMQKVFDVRVQRWRGLCDIPRSGLGLAATYRDVDAEHRFGPADGQAKDHDVCIAGDILRGLKRPPDCSAFGKTCTPEKPLGVTMVSSEGA